MIEGKPELSSNEVLDIFKKREKQFMKGFELANGVILKKITIDDLKLLNNSPFIFRPTNGFKSNLFLLEKQFNDQILKTNIYREIRNVVIALRLLKEGSVSGNYFYEIMITDGVKRIPSAKMEQCPRLFGKLGYPYFFTESDIPALNEIMSKIQLVDFTKRTSLHLAIKRFERGYDEEDKLIDFMIAFEALFLKGEKGSFANGKIISIACSALIGNNENDREQIKENLLKAYKIRNAIVHAGSYNRLITNKETGACIDTLPDLLTKVENYLRSSLNKMLE